MRILLSFILLFGFFTRVTIATESIKSCFNIEGMQCSSCKEKIKSKLRSEKAIQEVEISVRESSGEITYDPKKTSEEKIINLIKKAGYQAKKTECKN